jgi:hypothetical protein
MVSLLEPFEYPLSKIPYKRQGQTILGLFCLIFLCACTSKRVQPNNYLDWYKQHSDDFVSSKSVGPFGFQLTYLPVEILVLQEYGAEAATSPAWDSLLADRGDFDYYSLRIVSKESNTPILKHPAWSIQDYQQRVQYMAFQMQHDIKLLRGSDTSHCALYHFERSYDVTPFTTLMLAFPSGEQTATFLYNDQVLGLGPVMMPARKPESQSIPTFNRIPHP